MDNELLLESRQWLSLGGEMSAETIEYIETNKKLPDGYTEALLLINEIKADHNAHCADATVHDAADAVNVIAAADATTLATLIALLTEAIVDHNAHIVVTPTVHNSADAVNGVTIPDLSDVDENNMWPLQKALNELKAKHNTHLANATVHNSADTTNVTTLIDALGWKQVSVMEEGVSIEIGRETMKTGNRHAPVTGMYFKSQLINLKIPVSETSLFHLFHFNRIDPSMTEDAVGFHYKDNVGVKLTGFAVLVIDKNDDPDNESDIPAPDGARNFRLFWNCLNEKGLTENFKGEQNSLGLELSPAAIRNVSGGARNTKGIKWPFAKVS
jgi:hypothetical protein